MTRFTLLRRLFVWTAPILFVACRQEFTNPDQVAVSDAGALWTGNSTCDGCLQTFCVQPDGGPNAYLNCQKQSSCRLAMSKFTACFTNKPGLAECVTEMGDVRATGSDGSALLDCFLQTCFFTMCETVRSAD